MAERTLEKAENDQFWAFRVVEGDQTVFVTSARKASGIAGYLTAMEEARAFAERRPVEPLFTDIV